MQGGVAMPRKRHTFMGKGRNEPLLLYSYSRTSTGT
jgi:hypothetical protein